MSKPQNVDRLLSMIESMAFGTYIDYWEPEDIIVNLLLTAYGTDVPVEVMEKLKKKPVLTNEILDTLVEIDQKQFNLTSETDSRLEMQKRRVREVILKYNKSRR